MNIVESGCFRESNEGHTLMHINVYYSNDAYHIIVNTFLVFNLIIYACVGSVRNSGCFREINKREYTHPQQHGLSKSCITSHCDTISL